MAKKNADKQNEPAFEDLLVEAETLAGKIEEGGMTLDESIKAYEQGVANLRRCADLLRGAEEKVKVLLEKNRAFRLDDLDAGTEYDDDDEDEG